MSLPVGVALLLICCIGNAELWVILINRRHALPIKDHLLRRIRKVHDVGMTVVPLVLLVYVGLSQNGILRGGAFANLSWVQQALVCATAMGFLPFTIGVIRYQLRRLPAAVTIEHSEILAPLQSVTDSDTHQSMIGTASKLVQSLPGNQIWQLEVNCKHFHFCMQSPKANLKSVRLAHFSDVHLIGRPGHAWQQFLFDELIRLQPDAYVFTGDLLDRKEWIDFAGEQFERLTKVAPVYFILGNHDWHLDWKSIRETLRQKGAHDFGERAETVTVNGCRILFAGTEAPWIGRHPEIPRRSSEDFRILLSHTPDQRDFAVANDIDLMLSGHNHGGQIVLPLIGPVYSPSQYGVRYAGGCFQHHELLMHVSRGTGAKDPLRFRCPPEISLLHLKQVSNQSQ